MQVACLDLEGVLIPEIWINFAKKTGIKGFQRTTRDEPDYDILMQYRLDLLKENNITIHDIQKVINTMEPFEGALEFLHQLRENWQVIILSDTFEEFAKPLLEKLENPTIFCHTLEIAKNGQITNYKLRQEDQKRIAVQAFKSMNLHVVAAGDSYNDVSMLQEADKGILFSPPKNVIEEFPQFPVVKNYKNLLNEFK